MRSKLLFSVIALIGVGLPMSAQEAAESVSHEMIIATLGKMKAQQPTRTGDNYAIELGKRGFVLRRVDDGARLRLQASFNHKPSLALLNRYNEKAITTRAWHNGDWVVLESGLDCTLGVTAAGLEKFLTRFVNHMGEFETFLATAQPVKDDPAPAKKPGKQKPPLQIKPASDDREFVITFPTNDPEKWETAWKIEWDMENGKQINDQGHQVIDSKGKFVPAFSPTRGPVFFTVKKAFFKPGQKADWIQVLENTQPQEFYVPYYFRGTRFYDLLRVGGYTKLQAKEGGAISQLMGKSNLVIAELRDTGPAFKFGGMTRRGEELTLWANFQAGNYTYMVEYGFKDDGGIVFRHSPTGYNFFPHLDAAHMHGSYWKLGIKLGPEGNNDKNQVYVVKLPTDPKSQGLDGGKVDVKEITKESFLDWNAEEFTRIRVTNPNYSIVPDADKRPPLPIAYDLVTVQQGVARHRRNADEKFSLHDFWITRHDCPQKMYVHLGDYFLQGSGVNPKLQTLDKQNVTLWHSSSGLHVPRPEDGILKGNSSSNGQALVYWTSFELRPRNMFLTTPIYRSAP